MRKLRPVAIVALLAFWSTWPRTTPAQSTLESLSGTWHVNFTLNSVEHKLLLTAQPSGDGTIMLEDQDPGTFAHQSYRAAWKAFASTPTTFAISGKMDFRAGDCCRLTGTLVFTSGRNNFLSGSIAPASFSGHLLFVQFVPTAEDPSATQILTGDFTAIMVTATPPIVLFTPLAGDVIHRGTVVNIQWSVKSSAPIVSQKVQLSTDGTISYVDISPPLDGTVTSFDWQVPTSLDKTRVWLSVRVTDADENTGAGGRGPYRVKK